MSRKTGINSWFFFFFAIYIFPVMEVTAINSKEVKLWQESEDEAEDIRGELVS